MTRFFNKKNITILLVILLLAILFYIILPVSVPLIGALFTAMILEPVVRLIQKRFGIGRKFSVILVFIAFMALIGLSGYFITTKVITEAINV